MLLHFPFGIELVIRYPLMILILTIIPLLWIVAYIEARARKYALHNPWIALHLAHAHLPSRARHLLWWCGASMMLALLIGVLAVPERKTVEWHNVYGKVQITFLIDTSLSTVRAEDVAPNRLTAAKEIMKEMINMLWLDPELKGYYAVALIPFAGAAQPFYSPFTTSREQTLSDLAALDEHTITKQGTSLWAALRAYDELLLARPLHDNGGVDIAIILSDGGKEEGKGSERSLLPSLIKKLRDPHRMLMHFGDVSIITTSAHINRLILLYTIGIGKITLDQSGNRIPIAVPLVIRDKAGNFLDYYRENEQDPRSPVISSRLDEEILKHIAALGGGIYFHFSNKTTIRGEFKDLIVRHRQKTGTIPDMRYDSVSMWFLVPACGICFILFGYMSALVKIVQKTLTMICAPFRKMILRSRTQYKQEQRREA